MDKQLTGYLAALLQHVVYFGTFRNKPYIKYRSYTTSEDPTIIILKTFFGGTLSKKRYVKGKKYWDWVCYKPTPYIDFIVSIYPYTYSKDQFALWLEKHYCMRPKLNLQLVDLNNSYDRYIKEERIKKEEKALKEKSSIYKEEKIEEKKEEEKKEQKSKTFPFSKVFGASIKEKEEVIDKEKNKDEGSTGENDGKTSNRINKVF